MSLNTYSEALDIVKNRRLDAKANQDARIREVNIRIPEIAEITTMISRTSIDIMHKHISLLPRGQEGGGGQAV